MKFNNYRHQRQQTYFRPPWQRIKHTLPVFWSHGLNINSVCHRRIKMYINRNLTRCQNSLANSAFELLCLTGCPSARPRTLPNVVSNSTVDASCSLAEPLFMPSLPTTGASFRLLGIPVHPKYSDRCDGLPLALPEEGRYCSSTMTFCAVWSNGD